MLGNYKLVVDNSFEVRTLLGSYADETFTNIADHTILNDAIYIIGKGQFLANCKLIKTLIKEKNLQVIFYDPNESSESTVIWLKILGLEDLVFQKKVIMVTGGDIEEKYPNLVYENFMVRAAELKYNRDSMARINEIYKKLDKPYKFLFLNGRACPSRKYLLEQFKHSGLLDTALWTNLDVTKVVRPDAVKCVIDGQDVIQRMFEIRYLPEHYEIEQFREKLNILPTNKTDTFVKRQLFSSEWGDVYIGADMYIDTYFSVVTETIFEYPYSFRTEKIWKPIAIGHPFIAVANRGYYRDMRNLGFKTFSHLIDERFDMIDNNQDRIERIKTVIEDLCKQDLTQFLVEAQETCKYNQQHFIEMRQREVTCLPQRLEQFIKENFQ